MTKKTPRRAPDIAADLRQQILNGAYSGEQRFPRIRDLMDHYSVASGTIDRAVKILVRDGLLNVVHGRSITVRTPRRIRRDLIKDLRLEYERAITGDDSEGLFEAMLGDSDIEGAEVIDSHTHIPASADVAAALDIEPGADVLLRSFRYILGEEPFQTANLYMPADLAERAGLPEAERKGLGSIAHLRNAGAEPDRATISIITRRPTSAETTALAIPDGTSVVQRTRRLFSAGRPVELAATIVAADQVEHFLDIPLKGNPS